MKNKAKKPSKLQNKINELKSTSKGKAILKLIGWAIFFAFIFLLLIISAFMPKESKINQDINNNEAEEKEEDMPINSLLSKETFNNIKNELLNGNYDYKYEITLEDTKYIFNGTKKDDIETGYKETKEGVVKYYIDSTGIYEDKLTEKVPLNNLYENLDLNYLNFNNLMKTLDMEMVLISSTDLLIYDMASEVVDYQIALADKDLKYIKITGSNSDYAPSYEYYFEFNNIEVSHEK